ncbi:glucose dehydrogenase [FAD, quinone]-like [Stomoxys calcitrans]|uniref:glucose dehydrogenase [FAD, quinone]-like n=1 Tax=Stomoxys calcitrans TaxID=35570 RepID=UPI0027E382B2|nr:glucose dehydrogenase [FAD, quinone]-like [Stomoxys calcitrans]
MNLVPALAIFLQATSFNWNFPSVPQKNACKGMYNNVCFQPRGKLLGGSSGINFMIFIRGNRRDYDLWAESGNRGWSYDEVLPYFLKMENAMLKGLEDSPYHNRSGPLNVEYVRYRTQMAHAFVKGAQEAGHPETDYNGASQLGVSYVQASTQRGLRHSSYRAYVQPILNRRKNLHVFTFSRVTKLLMDPATKTAYGVEFLHRKKLYQFKARKEVILSAGSFMSPQLLMLSGIGPKDNLQKLGIQVIQELPVGMRMYEHVSHFGPTFLTNTTGQTLTPALGTIQNVLEFNLGSPNTVYSTIGGVEALTFLKTPFSKLPADWPDVEIVFGSATLASDDGTALKQGANFKDEIYNRLYRSLSESRQDHYTVIIMPFHPKSIGRVWLESKNPFVRPKIDPNYFDEEEDVEVMLHGIKESIRISQTPAMQRIGTKLDTTPVPGCESHEFGSDDYWRCSIRTMTYTLHHQVATCRMGPASDATAVVDPELKVHGVRKLRVVDGGVIPHPPTAHTNAVIFMIAEKAANMIKAAWET